MRIAIDAAGCRGFGAPAPKPVPTPVTSSLLAALVAVIVIVIAIAPRDAASAETAWSDAAPAIASVVKGGAPLVIRVLVPLCDNALIDCGSPIAGKPRDLEHNVYWGATFGERRFFERKSSGWTRVELAKSEAPYLERAVFRRRADGRAWGKAKGETIEELVVLDAVDGASIDRAVSDFQKLASRGGRVTIHEGDTTRDLAVSVAGYAGHNRLMDGKKLEKLDESDKAIPSFVIACESERYFGATLRAAGSETLVTTRTRMAPEGYVLDAIAKALGDDEPRADVRAAAVSAYATWQKLDRKAASSVF